MHLFTIQKNDAGQRLDKFLTKAVKSMPASLMYKSIRTKKIKVNRKRCTPEQMLAEGDTVQLFLPPDLFEDGAVEHAFMKLEPKLDIVYEDENLLLCDKRPGMLSQPDDADEVNTLVGHIKAYLYRKGEYDPTAENSFTPALCNRIDRNTGGIVIAAKNAETLRTMNERIKERSLTKRYLCAVHGTFGANEKSGSLVGYLSKDADNNLVTVYKNPRPGAKYARTDYKVIAEKNGLSLVDVELITGRTHQIRAQMSDAGHPLLGDGKYGVNRDDRKIGYKYQALYSYYLEIDGVVHTVDRDKIWFVKEFDL